MKSSLHSPVAKHQNGRGAKIFCSKKRGRLVVLYNTLLATKVIFMNLSTCCLLLLCLSCSLDIMDSVLTPRAVERVTVTLAGRSVKSVISPLVSAVVGLTS